MTPTRAAQHAFLESIAANPNDDVPRLIFADYLEEHGEGERAEFIRVQCRLASEKFPCTCTCEYEHGIGCPAGIKESLRRRERELLSDEQDRMKSELMKRTLPSDDCWWEAWAFRRGFVSSITLPCADFLKHAADIIEAVPMLEEVRWSDARPWSFAPRNPERSAWWYGLRRNSPHDVPDAIWKHLHGKKTFIIGHVWVCIYDAENGHLADELAHADLSQACLAFAHDQLAARRNFRPGIVAVTAH